MTVRKSIHMKRPVERTFRVFTEEIGKWWPLKEGFSFGGARAAEIFLEGREGGRFFERFADGEEFDVGVVTTYAPPARIVFTWKATEWDAATEVEVRFSPEHGGTRVDLEHRGWERAGARARDQRDRFNGGWNRVLACFGTTSDHFGGRRDGGHDDDERREQPCRGPALHAARARVASHRPRARAGRRQPAPRRASARHHALGARPPAPKARVAFAAGRDCATERP